MIPPLGDQSRQRGICCCSSLEYDHSRDAKYATLLAVVVSLSATAYLQDVAFAAGGANFGPRVRPVVERVWLGTHLGRQRRHGIRLRHEQDCPHGRCGWSHRSRSQCSGPLPQGTPHLYTTGSLHADIRQISSWIRYRQRRRRQETLTLALQSEQRAKVFEIAAWADEPGQAPVRNGGAAAAAGGSAGTSASGLARRGLRWVGIGRRPGAWTGSAEDKRRDKEQKQQMRATKRGGANAYAVVEWEGVPS